MSGAFGKLIVIVSVLFAFYVIIGCVRYIDQFRKVLIEISNALNEIRDDLIICWVGRNSLTGTPVSYQHPELSPIPQKVNPGSLRDSAPKMTVWDTLNEIRDHLAVLRQKAERRE